MTLEERLDGLINGICALASKEKPAWHEALWRGAKTRAMLREALQKAGAAEMADLIKQMGEPAVGRIELESTGMAACAVFDDALLEAGVTAPVFELAMRRLAARAMGTGGATLGGYVR